MKQIECEPFKPCVTLSQILGFDPERSETYTASPLMNAVLRAIAAVGPHFSKAITDYMQVPGKLLWPAVELLTGFDQLSLRQSIAMSLLNRLKSQHPDWSTDKYAHALGYSSRVDLYRRLTVRNTVKSPTKTAPPAIA